MKDKRLPFKERWLNKATRITGKSLDYICYSEDTFNDAVTTIKNSGCIKPNRIINLLKKYKQYH